MKRTFQLLMMRFSR